MKGLTNYTLRGISPSHELIVACNKVQMSVWPSLKPGIVLQHLVCGRPPFLTRKATWYLRWEVTAWR